MANALSRQLHDEEEKPAECLSVMFAISSPVPLFISQIQEYFKSKPVGRKFITQFCNNKKFKNLAHVKNDLLFFFWNRIVIPTTTMKQVLLTEFHSSPVARQSSIQATLARLTPYFYWQGMYQDTK